MMEAEPYYLDDDGKKCDAELHRDMLGNNPEADAAFERLLEDTRARSAAAANLRPPAF